jgi:hypothetical protein
VGVLIIAATILNLLAFNGHAVVFQAVAVIADAALAVWWLELGRRLLPEERDKRRRRIVNALFVVGAFSCAAVAAYLKHDQNDGLPEFAGDWTFICVMPLIVALVAQRKRKDQINASKWLFYGVIFMSVVSLLPSNGRAIRYATSNTSLARSKQQRPEEPSALASPYGFIKDARALADREFDGRYVEGARRELQRWFPGGNPLVLSVEFADLGNAIRAFGRYSWEVTAGTGNGEVRTYFSNAGSVQISAYCFSDSQSCEIDRVMAAAESDVLGHLGDWSIGRVLISARECTVLPISPPSLMIRENKSVREQFEKEIKDAIENERIGAVCSYDAATPHDRKETGLAEINTGRSVVLARRSLARTNHDLQAVVNRPVIGWPMMGDAMAKNVEDASDDPKLMEIVDRMIRSGETDENIAASIRSYRQTSQRMPASRN